MIRIAGNARLMSPAEKKLGPDYTQNKVWPVAVAIFVSHSNQTDQTN